MPQNESLRSVRPPAKLNLRLKITGRRPDGYHELETLMVPIGLFDELEIRTVRERKIHLACGDPSLPPGEENLVCRAADAFLTRCGLNRGALIRLTKHIPVAAGLGGGSSDAAWTLRTLNEIFDYPLSPDELASLGVGLGADVPFFLQDRPCLARGIGEVLSPLDAWPGWWYVIVIPPLAVSTAEVYAGLKTELIEYGPEGILFMLGKRLERLETLLFNDLETVTASRYPVIYTIKEALIQEGARGALMSGSGPSVFGIFPSPAEARAAGRRLDKRGLGRVFVVQDIS